MQNRNLKLYDLGLVDYTDAWEFQNVIFEEILSIKANNRIATDGNIQDTFNVLVFCEHNHVYTLGKSGKPNHLLASDDLLNQWDATFVQTNRGGDITYHGPGQLVVYPILDLDNFFTDIHKYMRLLEEVVINVCADFGVKSGRIAGLTGVWVDCESDNPRKVCAMGVKTSRWVTMHGLALNVSVNLDYFQHIVPCGISDKAVTSLENEIKKPVNLKLVKDSILKHFVLQFQIDLVDM